MSNPTPLEKHLLHMDLSKGLDERARPEVMPSGTAITVLENLVQDQTGAWVKRNGTTAGYVSDATGTGTYPSLPRKVMALVNGWGCVADTGALLHKQDNQGTFRSRQNLPDYNVNSVNFVTSTGGRSQNDPYGNMLKSSSSNNKYDAVVMCHYTDKATLTIVERATGTEYSYNLSDTPGVSGTIAAGGTSRKDVRIMFCGRYLHVYMVSVAATTEKVYCVRIDTNIAMPASAVSFTANLLYTGGTSLGVGNVISIIGGVGGTAGTRGWISISEASAQGRLLAQAASTGVNADSVVYPVGDQYGSLDYDIINSRLWMSAHVSGGSAYLRAVSSANSAVDSVSKFALAGVSPGALISCNTTTGGLQLVVPEVPVFGNSTLESVRVYNLATGSATSVTEVGVAYGWSVYSEPFYNSFTNKHYLHVTKVNRNTGEHVRSHVIIEISSCQAYLTNSSPTESWGSFRIACNLESMFGLGYALYLSKYSNESNFGAGRETSVVIPFQTAQRTAGIVFAHIRSLDQTAYGHCNMGGSTIIAHGGLSAYDGRRLVEQGFVDTPLMDAGAGLVAGNLDGSYKYVAVYRCVDANGASSYSKTFGPVSIVNVASASGKTTLYIQPCSVTNRDDGRGESFTFVEVYRTASGGTQYYLCATSQADIANSSSSSVQQITADAVTGILGVTDNLSDSDLTSQALMFRQPGTPNASADRYSAPAAKFVVQHKDRLFCSDAYGQRVHYSSFFVDGECPWFNPAFSFFVHAGSGPITALASMDGRLFIFKRDLIFVVDGDGPSEAGPNGNEFSPPQAIASRYGCIDHRSVVTTPDGIMYRSSRGFELLTRSLQVKWIGDRVWASSEGYPVTTGACVDSDSRVHYTLAVSETAAGSSGVAGIELVYDMSADTWSTAKYTGPDGTYGHCKAGCAVVVDSGVEKIAYADAYLGVQMSSTSQFTDNGTAYYVPFTFETGWMKTGTQARVRISRAMLLAKKVSNHKLTISVAYDYVDSYTQSVSFEPAAINAATIEELEIMLSKPQTLAVKVRIAEAAPTDQVTYPVTTGKGCDILGITLEIAEKSGTPGLKAALKG